MLQDTYVTVWRAAGSFSTVAGDPDAVGWLWTIASRRLIDGYRHRARQGAAIAMQPAVGVVPAAEDVVLDQLLGAELERALLHLAPELRQVLQAMVLDGFSVRETSALLGMPDAGFDGGFQLPLSRLLEQGGASVRGLVLDGWDEADLAV